MKFPVDNIRFDYFTVDQLIEDLAKYIDDAMPFYAREDEYLYLMELNGNQHIRFPGSITTDGYQHYFYFKIRQEGKEKVYYYIGMDIPPANHK